MEGHAAGHLLCTLWRLRLRMRLQLPPSLLPAAAAPRRPRSASSRPFPAPPRSRRLLIGEAGADPSLMFTLGAADPAICFFLHDAFSLYFAAIPGYMNAPGSGYGAGTIIPSELCLCACARQSVVSAGLLRTGTGSPACRIIPTRLAGGVSLVAPFPRPAGGGGHAGSQSEAGGGSQPVLPWSGHSGAPGQDPAPAAVDGVRAAVERSRLRLLARPVSLGECHCPQQACQAVLPAGAQGGRFSVAWNAVRLRSVPFCCSSPRCCCYCCRLLTLHLPAPIPLAAAAARTTA